MTLAAAMERLIPSPFTTPSEGYGKSGTAKPSIRQWSTTDSRAATARAIPGARLQWIAGMGHDLPPGVFPILVEAVAAHAKLGT